MTLRRIWEDVDLAQELGDLGETCVVCGAFACLERAHLTPRERDGRDSSGRRESRVVRVNPLDIVLLCGPATSTGSCHNMFDTGRLDLLPHLVGRFDEKIVRVVERMGLEQARRRLAPSDYAPQIERARIGAVAA